MIPRPESEAAAAAIRLRSEPPWLELELGQLCDTASWALVGGGLSSARRVAWYHLAPDELTEDLDPRAYLENKLADRGLDECVGLLTSRRAGVYHDVTAREERVSARCICTVGLSNALRAGDPPAAAALSTINAVCFVSVPLSGAARLEALCVLAEARTLAVREAAIASTASGQPASGTGTDCLVIACAPPVPAGDRRDRRDAPAPAVYAGTHTRIGSVIGRSALAAIGEGIACWRSEQRAAPQPRSSTA